MQKLSGCREKKTSAKVNALVTPTDAPQVPVESRLSPSRASLCRLPRRYAPRSESLQHDKRKRQNNLGCSPNMLTQYFVGIIIRGTRLRTVSRGTSQQTANLFWENWALNHWTLRGNVAASAAKFNKDAVKQVPNIYSFVYIYVYIYMNIYMYEYISYIYIGNFHTYTYIYVCVYACCKAPWCQASDKLQAILDLEVPQACGSACSTRASNKFCRVLVPSQLALWEAGF